MRGRGRELLPLQHRCPAPWVPAGPRGAQSGTEAQGHSSVSPPGRWAGGRGGRGPAARHTVAGVTGWASSTLTSGDSSSGQREHGLVCGRERLVRGPHSAGAAGPRDAPKDDTSREGEMRMFRFMIR